MESIDGESRMNGANLGNLDGGVRLRVGSGLCGGSLGRGRLSGSLKRCGLLGRSRLLLKNK